MRTVSRAAFTAFAAFAAHGVGDGVLTRQFGIVHYAGDSTLPHRRSISVVVFALYGSAAFCIGTSVLCTSE
jgi:hypothetical protein